jgi:hypothetical protein
LNLYQTSLGGDIGNWVLSSSLTQLRIHESSFYGDISAWILPDSLSVFRLTLNAVTGDISVFTMPSSATFILVSGSLVDYDSTSGFFVNTPNNLTIFAQDCSLTATQVDNMLVDCDTSGATNGTLNVSGNNAAPSATGLTAKTNLVGKSWTVTVTP